MGSVSVLVITPDGTVDARDIDNTLESFQGLVGGYIEPVTLLPDGTVGFVNENGKTDGLAPNTIATALLRRAGSMPDDYVVGTMVVTGPADDNGDITAVTPEARAVVAELHTD